VLHIIYLACFDLLSSCRPIGFILTTAFPALGMIDYNMLPLNAGVSFWNLLLFIVAGCVFYPVMKWDEATGRMKRAGWQAQIGMHATRKQLLEKEGKKRDQVGTARQDSRRARSRERSMDSQMSAEGSTGATGSSGATGLVRRVGSRGSGAPEADPLLTVEEGADEEGQEEEYHSFLDKLLSVENEYDLLPYPAFSVPLFTTLVFVMVFMVWASLKTRISMVLNPWDTRQNSFWGTPCFNDSPPGQREKVGAECVGYPQWPYPNWYDSYQLWWPEVAKSCQHWPIGSNTSTGLDPDGRYSWFYTDGDKWCDCVESFKHEYPNLGTICSTYALWMTMWATSVSFFLCSGYITMTIMGW
jgi:hypothetical protein